ncbi:MAG: tetratricopeptide repeat protein [Pseudomonadota bacterium]
MIRPLLISFVAMAISGPVMVQAEGAETPLPPKQTQTTMTCESGMIWDEEAEACVAPKDARMLDDALYEAVRELAYFGQPETALKVLDVMGEGNSDRVLTYRAFASRKAGNDAAAFAFYDAALAQNPNNLLARSYLGQAYVVKGDLAAAERQLREINQRGGAATWPEEALRLAIKNGSSSGY